MFNSIATKRVGQVIRPAYAFAGGSKRKATKKDLDKYDLIVVGANLGGIFSRHFDHIVHGKFQTMVCLDTNINQQYVIRSIYEQGRTTKTQYAPFAKMAINNFNAHSEGVGVAKFNPEQNEIELRNGRKIKYDYLVVAMGQKADTDSIKGFEEAWIDPEHPFFVCKDHPTWRTSVNKMYRWHYNFRYGKAYFYIPPAPFQGEIECYNFLLTKYIWNWYNFNGKLSFENSSLTILNGNDWFVQYLDKADKFIKDAVRKNDIKVEYGIKLLEVNKEKNTVLLENQKTGQKEERNYQYFYSLMPTKPHENLIAAGLTANDGFLDVNHKTLQHNKYKNIFGLGDVISIPTTKTFYGGFSQIHVVRNNLERLTKGLPLNAEYDGFTEAPLILGQDKLTWIQHYFNNKEGWMNLLGTKDPIIPRILYHKFSKMTKKSFAGLYLFKSWGPPYGKFKKTFKEGGSPSSGKVSTKSLEPEKKVAGH